MIDEKTFSRYAANPSTFRNDLHVDVDGTARRFGDVQDPWQRSDFESLDPALKRAAGRADEPAARFKAGRPRQQRGSPTCNRPDRQVGAKLERLQRSVCQAGP